MPFSATATEAEVDICVDVEAAGVEIQTFLRFLFSGNGAVMDMDSRYCRGGKVTLNIGYASRKSVQPASKTTSLAQWLHLTENVERIVAVSRALERFQSHP